MKHESNIIEMKSSINYSRKVLRIFLTIRHEMRNARVS